MAHEKIQKQLSEYLEYDLRQLIDKRVSAFKRQLEYIKTKNNSHLLKLYSNNWNDEMLKVVFVLNSFYQLVLGPLDSSARSSTLCGLGSDIPISYGSSIKFNVSRSRKINKTVESFNNIIVKLEINSFVMGLNSANDIVFNLAKDLYEDE
ncbi:hypothetical protein AN214_01244 [Pseudoalteromonas sp. P1-9]|uniref:hypothetical protein n=1 Tax=Pseudoalteromonas sp. P1-9 TaxID=1710354 RepID=UPI0006D635DC|nr:hypothetical protein [Pseudoalteromonas sp. P1-9]KPV96783.1 hypothetical protein AN214_01244 [Pseudoalteromonas sp. P1-9]